MPPVVAEMVKSAACDEPRDRTGYPQPVPGPEGVPGQADADEVQSQQSVFAAPFPGIVAFA